MVSGKEPFWEWGLKRLRKKEGLHSDSGTPERDWGKCQGQVQSEHTVRVGRQ